MTAGYNIIASQEMNMGPNGVAFTPEDGTLDFVQGGNENDFGGLEM